jgi:hypothetical protein
MNSSLASPPRRTFTRTGIHPTANYTQVSVVIDILGARSGQEQEVFNEMKPLILFPNLLVSLHLGVIHAHNPSTQRRPSRQFHITGRSL